MPILRSNLDESSIGLIIFNQLARATYSRIAGIWLTDLSADVNQSIKGSWSEFHPLKTCADRPKSAQTASADRWSLTAASANFSEAMIFGGFCWKVRKLDELPCAGLCFLLVSAVRRRVRKRSCVTWRARRVLIGQSGSRFWSKPWHAAYNITHFPSAATMVCCRAVRHYVASFPCSKIPVAFKIYNCRSTRNYLPQQININATTGAWK